MNARPFEIVMRSEKQREVYYVTKYREDQIRMTISDQGTNLDFLTDDAKKFSKSNTQINLILVLAQLKRAKLLPSLATLQADTLGDLFNAIKNLSQPEQAEEEVVMLQPSSQQIAAAQDDSIADALDSLDLSDDEDVADAKTGPSIRHGH